MVDASFNPRRLTIGIFKQNLNSKTTRKLNTAESIPPILLRLNHIFDDHRLLQIFNLATKTISIIGNLSYFITNKTLVRAGTFACQNIVAIKSQLIYELIQVILQPGNLTLSFIQANHILHMNTSHEK